jgi:hypothetical protein
MNIIEIVEGNNLRELIENALSVYGSEYNNLEITNYSLNANHKNTIVKGNLIISYYDYDGFYHHESELNFEVNIGTHKDDLVLFDEFEVIIN